MITTHIQAAQNETSPITTMNFVTSSRPDPAQTFARVFGVDWRTCPNTRANEAAEEITLRSVKERTEERVLSSDSPRCKIHCRAVSIKTLSAQTACAIDHCSKTVLCHEVQHLLSRPDDVSSVLEMVWINWAGPVSHLISDMEVNSKESSVRWKIMAFEWRILESGCQEGNQRCRSTRTKTCLHGELGKERPHQLVWILLLPSHLHHSGIGRGYNLPWSLLDEMQSGLVFRTSYGVVHAISNTSY